VSLLARFLDPSTVSLKICGVTVASDARQLVALGVDALGVNFWPSSKRYLAPADAAWLRALGGQILRVGVFVNDCGDLPIQLFESGLIDAIQLHGDELPEDLARLRMSGAPVIKAIGVASQADLGRAAEYQAAAILLDAHAPGIYGGTGEVFDWDVALAFKQSHQEIPIILAGGIAANNAELAARHVRPSALDVASGAESAPGTKDFTKVAALLEALGRCGETTFDYPC
jgi:phosphoribosylanthranilate isomerase